LEVDFLGTKIGFTAPKQPKNQKFTDLRKPCAFTFVKDPKTQYRSSTASDKRALMFNNVMLFSLSSVNTNF